MRHTNLTLTLKLTHSELILQLQGASVSNARALQ